MRSIAAWVGGSYLHVPHDPRDVALLQCQQLALLVEGEASEGRLCASEAGALATLAHVLCEDLADDLLSNVYEAHQGMVRRGGVPRDGEEGRACQGMVRREDDAKGW